MSDLLNSASLVLIPSGYAEDKVYSAVPTDGSGDLSFTRASNGTRINWAGLVEVTPWNLLTYSEDLSNAIWTKEPGNSIITNSTTAPNGTTTADTISATATNELNTYQFANTDAGVFTYSVYIKKNATNLISTYIYQSAVGFKARGEINFDNGTFTTSLGTGAIESVGNGWYRVFLTATLLTAQHSFGFYTDSVTGTRSVYAWGAMVNIGATAKPYFPTTDRLNVPRLTYQNGGGGCPSLLLEKQSTNLITYSEQMDNGAYGKGDGIAITANATTSPDGTQNADKIYTNTTTNGDHYFNRNPFTTISSSTAYTYSIFAKKGEFKYISVESTIQGNSYKSAIIDLNNGTIDSSDYAVTPKVEDYGNGWYRISVFGTSGASQTSADTYIIVMNDSKNRFYTGNGVNGIFTWGWQLEASSYPTSYIPTTSASATRVADACFKTGISSLFGTNQGTFFLDFVYIGQRESSSSFPYIFDILNASLTRLIMYGSATNVGYDTYDLWDSSNFVLGNINLYYNTRYKLAVKYSSSGVVCYLNGTLAVNSTASFNPQMSGFYLARRYSDTEINSLKVNQNLLFPTTLTNAELASLTTI